MDYTGPYGWSATGLASGFSRDPNNPSQYFFQDQSGKFLGNPMSYDQLGNYFDLSGSNAGGFKYGPQGKELAPGIQNFNYNPRGYYTGPGQFNLVNPDVAATATGNAQMPNFSGGPDWTKYTPQQTPQWAQQRAPQLTTSGNPLWMQAPYGGAPLQGTTSSPTSPTRSTAQNMQQRQMMVYQMIARLLASLRGFR